MKSVLKESAKQALPILISGILAALISYLSAILTATATPATTPPGVMETGFLGSAIKAIHSTIRVKGGIV